MNINKPVDIENEVRLALTDYFQIYCRPLPEKFFTPSLLVTNTGGNSANTIDTFIVNLDARAETDGTAYDLLSNALGVLEKRAQEQFGALRYVSINSLARWGADPVRPDLKLCSATVQITCHRESVNIDES